MACPTPPVNLSVENITPDGVGGVRGVEGAGADGGVHARLTGGRGFGTGQLGAFVPHRYYANLTEPHEDCAPITYFVVGLVENSYYFQDRLVDHLDQTTT
ncbi:hypothetical protein DPEC_G00358850 [Dallia pectoralis]|uniref:Uncharacterized protein n=1 Tax=Dallia pectoralis TaxID=75939 RepID=A0ACC2F0D5_DALPE|nr:hypothetical protein DPEC_G00358850 [Dallia pectoralis]